MTENKAEKALASSSAREAMAAAITLVQNGVEIDFPLSPNEARTTDAILAALSAAGWALVPVELTTAMHDSGTAAINRDGTIHKAWRAMLAAARQRG